MKHIIALLGLAGTLLAQDVSTNAPMVEPWAPSTAPEMVTNITVTLTPRQALAMQWLLDTVNNGLVREWNKHNFGQPVGTETPKPTLWTVESYFNQQAQGMLHSFVVQQTESDLGRITQALRNGADTGEFLHRLADAAETNVVGLVELVAPAIGATP